MPSLIPGYEYDIYISYRHNDNKGDQWVTEFVNSLKIELQAIVKVDVLIYFDRNPHDGLLETHSVDDSLKGKLKCLVFIPIISQTYCDPKSFAWNNEFLIFKKLASLDHFGLKVKLGNGNISSRVLPVRIHDLDTEDKALLENELGPLRSIDFIFKTTGVNRSLRSHEDHPHDNVNNTYYRDQINKVAHSIKEIILGIRNPASGSAGFNTVLSMITPVPNQKSIAVLPFINMSKDPDQEFFSDGITEEILNSLCKLNDLKVAGRTSSFRFKGHNIDLREVGEKLGVTTVLEGSIRKNGNQLRITAQLVNVEDGFHLWSERYDRQLEDVFAVQDEIANAIAEKLKLTLILQNSNRKGTTTDNPHAYESYLMGRHFLYKMGKDFPKSIDQFKKSVELDPDFALAYASLSVSYTWLALWNYLPVRNAMPVAEEYARKAHAINENLGQVYYAKAFINMCFYWNWQEAENCFLKAIQLNPNDVQASFAYALNYLGYIRGRFDDAERIMEAAIVKEPTNSIYNAQYSLMLNMAGKFKEAENWGQRAYELDPGAWYVFRSLGPAKVALGKTEEGIQLLLKGLELSGHHHWMVAELANAYLTIDDKHNLDHLLNDFLERSKTQSFPKSFMAYAHAILGDKDTAIRMYKEGIENRDPDLPWHLRTPRSHHNEIILYLVRTLKRELKFPE